MDPENEEDDCLLGQMEQTSIGSEARRDSAGHGGTLNIPTTCVFVIGIMAGSGFLALPKSVDNTGWIGIVLLVLFCLLSIYTSSILARCWTIMIDRGIIRDMGHVRCPYPAIGEATFGKIGKHAVTIAINFTNFGTVVVYILIASENIHSLVSNYTTLSTCYIALIVTGAVLPVTWFGTPKDFWVTALAATLATLTASLLVFSNILKDRPTYTNLQHTNVGIVTFFTAFGTMGFSYGGHPVFPTVQADMKEPRDFWKASLVGYLILLIIYMPSSIASYYIYGDKVQPNVLDTMSHGPFRTIATILMTIHLFSGIIIIINPVCQELEQLLKINPSGFTPKRAICRTLVVVTALFVAESVPHFSAILALVGGSTITLLAYICPSVFYLKLASKQPSYNDCWLPISVSLHEKVLNIEIMILGLVAGLAATYSAVTDLADSRFSVPCYINPKIPDT